MTETAQLESDTEAAVRRVVRAYLRNPPVRCVGLVSVDIRRDTAFGSGVSLGLIQTRKGDADVEQAKKIFQHAHCVGVWRCFHWHAVEAMIAQLPSSSAQMLS